MIKEMLQQRIQEINNEMTQMRANYAKLEGHLGECSHWLIELCKKEKEALEQAKQDSETLPTMDGKEQEDGQVNDQAESQAA